MTDDLLPDLRPTVPEAWARMDAETLALAAFGRRVREILRTRQRAAVETMAETGSIGRAEALAVMLAFGAIVGAGLDLGVLVERKAPEPEPAKEDSPW